jgi:hypothetical protein
MTGSGMSTLSTRRRRDGGVGQRVWDSQKNVERSSKVLVWSCASGGGVTRYTPCAWPAGWGLSCPPRVAIRRTTLWCCSFSSRFSSRFPAPPKEVKVHTGTDYHSMVSECRIWPSGGQESKKKPAAAQCSRLVTHVNTLWPLRCLSARIGRDAEGSSRYGRR